MSQQLEPSEFEKSGPHRWGSFGIVRAWEKIRYAMRAERDPDTDYDADDPGDKFGHGGVPEYTKSGDEWHKMQ